MRALQHLMAWAYRGAAVAVLGLVLMFPAWKGLWLGYLPVAVGLALAGALWVTALRHPCGIFAEWSAFRFALVAYAVPAALQVALLVLLRPQPLYDGQFVFAEAVELAHTGRMSALTYYPPLQTWWYAGWFRLFGASSLVAQLSHLPLAALVTWLTHRLARQAGVRHARLVTLLVAFYPSFLAYVLVTPYYHYLYTAAVLATAWGWLASLERARGAAAAGLASGLGALAKATQLIAPAQALVFWLLAPRPSEPAAVVRPPGSLLLRRLVLFLAGMAVCIAPWTIRNFRVFGEVVPVCTSGGLVLHSANNPESNGLYSGVPDTADIGSPEAMLAHSRESSRRAREFMRTQPGAFLRLAWIKVLHTWGGEATFAELINRNGRPLGRLEDVFSAMFYAGWVCVVAWWAAGSVGAWRTRAPLTPLELACAVVVLSNLVVYAVFEGGDRHHLPFVPLLLVGAWAVRSRTGLATTPPPA